RIQQRSRPLGAPGRSLLGWIESLTHLGKLFPTLPIHDRADSPDDEFVASQPLSQAALVEFLSGAGDPDPTVAAIGAPIVRVFPEQTGLVAEERLQALLDQGGELSIAPRGLSPGYQGWGLLERQLRIAS